MHQFIGTKSAEANKSLKTDVNGAERLGFTLTQKEKKNKVASLVVTELSNYGNPLFKAVICLEYIAPLPPLLNIAIYAL